MIECCLIEIMILGVLGLCWLVAASLMDFSQVDS